jgi:hypothetical protein
LCSRGGEGFRVPQQINSHHKNHRRFCSCPGFKKSKTAISGVHDAIISEARTLAKADNQRDDSEVKKLQAKNLQVERNFGRKPVVSKPFVNNALM